MKVELLQKSTGMVMTASSSRKSRSGCALALLDGPANSAPFEREHTVFLSSFLISNRVLFDLGSRFPFMLAPRYPLQPRKLPADVVIVELNIFCLLQVGKELGVVEVEDLLDPVLLNCCLLAGV